MRNKILQIRNKPLEMRNKFLELNNKPLETRNKILEKRNKPLKKEHPFGLLFTPLFPGRHFLASLGDAI